MTPPPVHHRPAERRHGARVLSALAAFLLATTVLVLDPGTADASGSRSVSMSVSCSPSNITAGSTTSCTITIEDTASGTKRAPAGTVDLLVDSGPMQVITPCTLAPISSSRSSCSGVRVLFQAARTYRLTADYLGSDVHADRSRTTSITVSSSSQVGAFSTSSASSGTLGQTIRGFGYGCAGSNRYVGVFVALGADPLVAAITGGAFRPAELIAATDGSYGFTVTIPTDNEVGTFMVRYYCASAPVSSIFSSAILNLAPVITYTIAKPLLAAAVMSTTVTVDAVALTASVGEVRAPDALAAVDTVDLPAAQMALLKERVDTALPVSDRVTRLAMAFRDRVPERAAVDLWTTRLTAGTPESTYVASLTGSLEYQVNYAPLLNGPFVDRVYSRVLGRAATPSERGAAIGALTNRTTTRPAFLASIANSPEHVARVATRSYVLAAYQVLTPVVPTSVLLDRFTRQLDDQIFRVQMLEDLVLTRATAAAWVSALATAPSTARF